MDPAHEPLPTQAERLTSVRRWWRFALLACVALAGAGLATATADGARHRTRPRHVRLVATKARGHGRVPAAVPGRPPLRGIAIGSPSLPAPPPPVPPAPPDPVPTTPTVPPPACPTALGVSEAEYYTRLSRSTVCPGALTVELRNAGMDDHDLKILDTDSGQVVATWEVTHPGTAAQRHVVLAAGSYRLFCTLSDGNGSHDAQGMHATLTVG